MGRGLVPHAGTVPEYGGGPRIMHAIAICMSANACVSCAFVTTRLSMVVSFWMDTLARLLSDKAIQRACSSSSTVLAPKSDSPAIMQLISCISEKATVQCAFPLGQV